MRNILKVYIHHRNVTHLLTQKCKNTNFLNGVFPYRREFSIISQFKNDTETVSHNESTSLLSKYNETIEKNFFQKDPYQLSVVHKLNEFHRNISSYAPASYAEKQNFFSSFKDMFSRNEESRRMSPQVKGVYLYGGVG